MKQQTLSPKIHVEEVKVTVSGHKDWEIGRGGTTVLVTLILLSLSANWCVIHGTEVHRDMGQAAWLIFPNYDENAKIQTV